MPSLTAQLLAHGVVTVVASGPRSLAVGVVAVDPGVHANNTIPGIAQLQSLVGGLVTIAVIASLAGFVCSAIAWGLGSHHGNSRFAQTGKAGVIISLVAAFLIGGGDALISFM